MSMYSKHNAKLTGRRRELLRWGAEIIGRGEEMSRQDDYIFKCAKRMVEKMDKSIFYKLNGEFPKPVQIEIERMKNHCRDKLDTIQPTHIR